MKRLGRLQKNKRTKNRTKVHVKKADISGKQKGGI